MVLGFVGYQGMVVFLGTNRLIDLLRRRRVMLPPPPSPVSYRDLFPSVRFSDRCLLAAEVGHKGCYFENGGDNSFRSPPLEIHPCPRPSFPDTANPSENWLVTHASLTAVSCPGTTNRTATTALCH